MRTDCRAGVLATWCATFGADEAATLVVYAPGVELDRDRSPASTTVIDPRATVWQCPRRACYCSTGCSGLRSAEGVDGVLQTSHREVSLPDCRMCSAGASAICAVSVNRLARETASAAGEVRVTSPQLRHSSTVTRGSADRSWISCAVRQTNWRAGATVLDVGAGEAPYAELFQHLDYVERLGALRAPRLAARDYIGSATTCPFRTALSMGSSTRRSGTCRRTCTRGCGALSDSAGGWDGST